MQPHEKLTAAVKKAVRLIWKTDVAFLINSATQNGSNYKKFRKAYQKVDKICDGWRDGDYHPNEEDFSENVVEPLSEIAEILSKNNKGLYNNQDYSKVQQLLDGIMEYPLNWIEVTVTMQVTLTNVHPDYIDNAVGALVDGATEAACECDYVFGDNEGDKGAYHGLDTQTAISD